MSDANIIIVHGAALRYATPDARLVGALADAASALRVMQQRHGAPARIRPDFVELLRAGRLAADTGWLEAEPGCTGREFGDGEGWRADGADWDGCCAAALALLADAAASARGCERCSESIRTAGFELIDAVLGVLDGVTAGQEKGQTV